jgi:glycosyltransferase involved in cell wall biosynthesis
VVKRLAFAVPGDLATPTGGYAYDRRMISELKILGWTIDVIDLGDGFPRIDTKARTTAQALLTTIPERCPIVIDGLAFGVLPEAAASLHARNPLIALVHHPLALESGLSNTEAKMFRSSERAALALAHRVIVTSPATARLLTSDYHVPADRITVARPGSDPVVPAKGSCNGIVRLLSVGSLVPRKGYDVLIAALATLADLPWQLTIAGDAERDRAAAAAIRSNIARSGLTERIALVGAVAPARLAELYLAADLFVLASRFEGYGMAYAEATAHGLPVIGTTAGAIPETVPSEAAILVAPDDAAALARALRQLIADKNERHRIAAAARSAAARLPTWHNSGLLFAGAIEAAT